MTSESKLLQLYLVHRTALMGYAQQIVGSRAGAEDIVQETYLRFMAQTERDTPRHPPITNPVGYLYRIVRNLALDRGRRAATAGETQSLTENAPAPLSSPEDDILLRDDLRLVETALARLPVRTRHAFELHRLHGYTLQETAGHLGLSVTRVHQMVRTALTECANELSAADQEPQDHPGLRRSSGKGR